jgi:hypothetical protein
MNRDQMIAALELINRKERMKAEFDSRYGQDLDFGQCFNEKLCECLAAGFGFELNTRFTARQFLQLYYSELKGADLEEFRKADDWFMSQFHERNQKTKWEQARLVAMARWRVGSDEQGQCPVFTS